MTAARAMLPTDLLALVSGRGPSCRNEARPFERLGAAEANPNPMAAIEPWLSFATGRHAWITARRGRLLGLVSARRRGGRRAWEIDSLIDSTPDLTTLPGLLECALADAGRSSAEKLFVRVSEGSRILPLLRGSGFAPFANETLYFRSGPITDIQGKEPVRPMSQQDVYPAFRLYNQVQPETRRRLEAATFDEWQAATEKRWLRGGVRLVSEASGQLTGLLYGARLPQGLMVQALMSEIEPDRLGSLIGGAASALSAAQAGCFALCGDELGLTGALENLGFQPAGAFVSLVCRTTSVARFGKMVPNISRTAVVT